MYVFLKPLKPGRCWSSDPEGVSRLETGQKSCHCPLSEPTVDLEMIRPYYIPLEITRGLGAECNFE